ncbi:hypothetical protein HYU14_01035 [Candidatus Woesearchaeota archaeon]|nr:hypothetical protein [Candidatus Woesearchaeota archaeon]
MGSRGRKKAEGLSMNIIIIAILGLLVLVIVGIVFRGVVKESINEYRQQKTNELNRAQQAGLANTPIIFLSPFVMPFLRKRSMHSGKSF